MTDHEAMQTVRAGETNLLGILFDRHHRKLFNYFLKHTGNRPASEDMVQEVYLRLLKYRGSYRGENDDDFGIWLYTVARNIRFDWYRSRARSTGNTVPLETATAVPDYRPGPDVPAEQAEERALLKRALSLLPDDRREIIIMSKYQELPYSVIARILGITEGAVKVRVFRALKELSAIYTDLSGEACHEV